MLSRWVSWRLGALFAGWLRRVLYAVEVLGFALAAVLDMLSHNPLAGRERPELVPSLRSFAVGNYVAFYLPLDQGVEVVWVLSDYLDFDASDFDQRRIPPGPGSGLRPRPLRVPAFRSRSLAQYCTPRRGQSVPRPACGGAMLTLLRLPC